MEAHKRSSSKLADFKATQVRHFAVPPAMDAGLAGTPGAPMPRLPWRGAALRRGAAAGSVVAAPGFPRAAPGRAPRDRCSGGGGERQPLSLLAWARKSCPRLSCSLVSGGPCRAL